MPANLTLSIETNAGGVAKSTISYNLAYELGVRGYSVALLDIDPNESLTLFCGLGEFKTQGTMANVYHPDFNGNWPLVTAWQGKIDKIQVCKGGKDLHETIREVSKDLRGAYTLADRLSDYPLSHDFVIIDCPATLEPLPLTALAASSHVLIPIQPEYKASQSAAAMIEWYYFNCKRLRLKPTPKILGIVPTRWKSDWGAHRSIVEELPLVCKNLGIQYFSPIRESADILNASGRGLPLGIYRPGKEAAKKLLPQLTELVILTRKEQSEGIKGFNLDEIEQSILLLLLRFQQNPASVDANVFPCLRLSEDLKIAIRQLGLGANHARSLQKLNSKNLKVEETKALKIRQDATSQVLQERLTVAQTRFLVAQTIAEHAPETKPKPNHQISSLIRDVSATKVEDIQQEQLRDLLAVLEAKAKEIRKQLD